MSDSPTAPADGLGEPVAVRLVVREVVAATAPEELPLLDRVEELPDERALREITRKPKREPLGFGLSEAIALIAPVLWLVLEKFAEKIAEESVDEAARRGKAKWRRLWKREKRHVLPPLSEDEIARAKRAVIDALRHPDRPDKEVQAIAGLVEKALPSQPSD